MCGWECVSVCVCLWVNVCLSIQTDKTENIVKLEMYWMYWTKCSYIECRKSWSQFPIAWCDRLCQILKLQFQIHFEWKPEEFRVWCDVCVWNALQCFASFYSLILFIALKKQKVYNNIESKSIDAVLSLLFKPLYENIGSDSQLLSLIFEEKHKNTIITVFCGSEKMIFVLFGELYPIYKLLIYIS